MSEKEQIIAKIKQVIQGAAQFKDEQFRLILEGLVKKGGREAEFLLVSYITASNVDADTRENIIRCTGYIQSPVYLVPLKKIIDQEPRLPLKKAAVITLSKYNNQRALNILNAALQSIKNPYLLNTINEQISMIKKNNPLLGLIPRFLQGDKDLKSFMVVVDILKKILKPEDAKVFINYLKNEDPAIRIGSFEILCATADKTYQTYLFDFYYYRMQPEANPMEGYNLPEATQDEMLALSKHIKVFFTRFPALILTQLRRLNATYESVEDEEVKKIIIGILCHSRAPQALTFIKEIYSNCDAPLREFIIEESSGNEQAVEFLFEKYKAGQNLKEKVVKALLNSHKGFDYFATHFYEFDENGQEMIVKNLPENIKPQMVAFIKKLLQSDLTHLKRYLLLRIRDNFLFSFRDILFDPDRSDELLAIEEEYLSAVSLLFPVRTVKHLLDKISSSELEIAKAKRYFEQIITITKQEIIVNFPDSNILELLVLKVIGACSLELNQMLLTTLEQIKTLDRNTYKGLYDALNLYNLQRGDNLVEDETYALKRIRDNYQNIIEDVRRIDTLDKEIRAVIAKSIPDLNQLRRIIETYHMGAAFKGKSLIRLMADFLRDVDEKYLNSAREFFKGFPILAQLVKEARINLARTEGQSIDPESGPSFHDKLRIVIRFQEKFLTALFKDQLDEVIPHFNVVPDALQLVPTDILVCDAYILKELINAKMLNTKRIYVILENRNEYSTFKALSPKTFIQPISVYRSVKMILQELYLMRT